MPDIKQYREVKSLPESVFNLIIEGEKERGMQHECKQAESVQVLCAAGQKQEVTRTS